MSPPSSSSNRLPQALHGYEYNPVLNRFFKSSSSYPTQASEVGTSTEHPATARNDAPPAFKFKRPIARPPAMPLFDPETDPGSAAKRARHATKTQYATACSTSTRASHISFPSPRGIMMNGDISTITLSKFKAGGSCQDILFVGSTFSEALICDLQELFNGPSPDKWTQVDLSPCITNGALEPLTSISSESGVTCFAATSGCVLTTPRDTDFPGLPQLVQRASFTNTTWSMCLTSQYLLMGCEKSIIVHDYHHRATFSELPQSSIFAIERQNNSNFLLGTRSGNVIQFDLRKPDFLRNNQLLDRRSIYHLKHIDTYQFLIVGAAGYAKLHDARYLTSDPIMSLDGLDNGYERSYGVTISQEGSLVCMAGRDETVKVWDLRGHPVPGFGLQPITTQSTRGTASGVLFVDQVGSAFGAVDQGPAAHQPKQPCGPGILFALKKALHWLGPQT